MPASVISTPPAGMPAGARYVRLPRPRIFKPREQCRFCGSFRPECPIAVCMLCGAPQCHGNGLGNGQCSICYAGLLPGWSGNDASCQYTECKRPAAMGFAPPVKAVARGRGGKMICRRHADHQGLGAQRLAGWALVGADGGPI